MIGHVGAAGAIARVPYDLRRGPATDIATAPDGTAWFALDHCVLGHVAGASVTFLPAPIRVHSLGFDPSGALWLASAARVLRTTPAALSGAGCDETPPRVRIRPATGGTIRLAALREGVRITVPEPAQLSLTAGYGRRAPHRVQTRKRSLTFRVPRAWLSRIERGVAVGQRPRLTLFVDAVDREGNAVTVGGEVRVRR